MVAIGRTGKGPEPVFFVRDNGVGFDMQRADKFLMPFHRLHQETEFEGAGIGLATTQRIVGKAQRADLGKVSARVWLDGLLYSGGGEPNRHARGGQTCFSLTGSRAVGNQRWHQNCNGNHVICSLI